MVQFAAVSKKRPSRTNNLVKKGQENATELHHGAKVESQTRLTSTMTSKHGISDTGV